MKANVKYENFYTYDKINNIVFDMNKMPLPKNHVIYLILDKYKNMLKILNDILIVPNRSMEEADKNLVFKGKDSKGRYQYCYGVDYVKERLDKKLENFLKIYKKMDIIQSIIKKGLEEKEINKQFLFASILLLELTFYIRLGKEIYLNENETIGLLTLKKNNLIQTKDTITISFKAKSNKQQEFVCRKEDQPLVFFVLSKLIDNASSNDSFIFTYKNNKHFTERILNKRLKEIDLRLKDFRTYGVNILFLKTIYDNMDHSPKIDIKKLIKTGVADAAAIIGHTKNISKKSYLSEQLVNATEEFLKDYSNQQYSFDSFIKKVIDKCLV
ncbi:putative DNA topoisomerase type I [Yalta virus]|nr:putative DNA topoisomerase type I [Yalta virus]